MELVDSSHVAESPAIPAHGRLVRRSGCPGCGSSAVTVVVSEPYSSEALAGYLERHYHGRAELEALAGSTYELARCTECSLGYQVTVPDPDLLEAVYERWISPNADDRLKRGRDLGDYRYHSEQIQFLLQALRLPPREVRVLDFGMGWADWATMARAYGCRAAGTELSVHRARHARSLGIEVLSWDELPGRKFHFINVEQVLEHLLDPAVTLRHLAASLEDDGLLRVAVPDSRAALAAIERSRGFAGLAAKHVMPVAPLEHVNSFEYRSLAAAARHAGLELVRPRLRQIYNSSSGWFEGKNAVRLLLRPLYRHVYPKSTVQYFRLSRAPS